MSTVTHTPRITNVKEMAILFPEKSKGEPTGDAAGAADAPDAGRKLRPRKASAPSGKDTTAEVELERLRTQASQLSKAMHGAAKAKNPIPLQSKQNTAIDGLQLVLHTSWPWRSVPSNSRSREFQHIGGVAALEFGIIEEYRVALITPTSGAFYLRYLLANAMKTQFNPSLGIVKTEVKFIFADQIALPDHDTLPSFAIGDLLPELHAAEERQCDVVTIQSLVRSIERCPLSWQDPANEDDSKFPPLHSESQAALVQLVKVCAKIKISAILLV